MAATTLLPPGRRLAEATPATRNRFLDALRTGSLLLVVLGHGLMLTMTCWPQGGMPYVGNALDSLPALMPVTWLLQPMSLFFFAGAAANITAYSATTRKGGDYHSWLWARVRRLYRPVLFYLAVMVPLAVVVSVLAGPSGQVLLMGITGLFWFIAVYTAATALLPALDAWTSGQGWAPLVVLCLVVGGVDLVKRGLSLPDAVGLPNIFLVWLVFTELGLLYRAGRLTPAVATGLAVGGLAAMLVCVYALGYPVSMVGTASGPSNTVPPTVALMFQGIFLIGLAVRSQRPITRWLERPRVWIATCTASACAMTVYLWHLPALILAMAIVHYAGWFPDGVAQASSGVPIPIPGDQYAGYLLVVIALFLVLTLGCVVAFWRFEHATFPLWDSPVRHPWRFGRRAQAWASGLAVLAVSFGVLVIGVTGFEGFPFRVTHWSVIPLSPPAALACMLAGLLALRQLSRGPHPPPRVTGRVVASRARKQPHDQ